MNESEANPNLLLSTVLTGIGVKYNSLCFGVLGGLVQHTQQDAWFEVHNDYMWATGTLSWDPFYGVLRDNELMRTRAKQMGLDFHHGVSLVIRAYVFGLITDLWGDAPYTDALQAELGGPQYSFPKFDQQDVIYKGILDELKQANKLLSQADASYDVRSNSDVFFGGKASKWRRFANALALRYYMRLSEKEPAFAKQGVEQIMANQAVFPIFTDAREEVLMDFVGNNSGDAWPSNTIFDASGSNFRRMKMCATLVESLQQHHDPRLPVWAKRVEIPIEVHTSAPANTDRIVNGVRVLSPDMLRGIPVNTDPEYVGLPPSGSKNPSAYNMNPTPGQTSINPHVSYLSDTYKSASGDLLKARLLAASEVNFMLAEAALKGWQVPESAKFYYERGIWSSLQSWGQTAAYASYIKQEGVAFNHTLAQLMEQKWISNWTTAAQAWFDYRRTGFPQFKAGPAASRSQLPLRIPYTQQEINVNQKNVELALKRIQKTAYSQVDMENSAWSKSWLLQGTGKPW
ncbi:SusD/RagB family nutrient-binding outer membrane lipoprotein [Sphingobacterium sp. Mn56C]|uniref:SusD/RagB family nutrient-binding outer membrane lipoprotein n=1 Tax=Sphingobacterium sp. Mn56C TaxID=3395261 RepID=UPI003BD43F8A